MASRESVCKHLLLEITPHNFLLKKDLAIFTHAELGALRRVKDAEKRRVLDDAARKRRARKAVEALEQDNFHEDPHADLVMSKKVPKFADSNEKPKKKKAKSAEYYKMRFRKTFGQLVEEDGNFRPDPPNYLSAQAPPSNFPDRHFCAVCGFPSNYTCIPCGARYCSVRCLGTHLDTRCLKWTA